MPIQPSGSVIVNREFDNDDASVTILGIRDALEAAGWTQISDVGGYTMRSARTPQRLSCLARLTTSGALTLIKMWDVDQSIVWSDLRLGSLATRKLRITANSYQFFTYQYQTAEVQQVAVMGGVPYIFPHLQGLEIANVVPGNPTVVETVLDHQMIDGQAVFLSDIEGIVGINDVWTVQIVTSKRIRLVNSNLSGVYVVGTGVAAPPGKIARAIWGMSDNDGGAGYRMSFRVSVDSMQHAVNQRIAINQNAREDQGFQNAGRLQLVAPSYGSRWFNNQYLNAEPYLRADAASGAAPGAVFAQLWDAVLVNYHYDAENQVPFDGHVWSCYTGARTGVNKTGSLYLMVT